MELQIGDTWYADESDYEEEMEIELRKMRYGIATLTPDGISIIEEAQMPNSNCKMALVRCYSNDADCECPVVYSIVKEGGKVLWRQQIAYMSEYIYNGEGVMSASNDQRNEAYEKWEEMKRGDLK